MDQLKARCLDMALSLKKFNDLCINAIDERNMNILMKPFILRRQNNDLIHFSEAIYKNITILRRKQIKCVFFGKTSSGKSALINAILHDNILPSDAGRVTPCFVHITGFDGNDGYVIDHNRQIHDLEYLNGLENMDDIPVDSVIQVSLPHSEYPKLMNNRQFIDSPGSNYLRNHNDQITNHCEDADVFICMVDGRGTLENSDRGFFRVIQERIQNPDVLFLINKWDTCDDGRDEIRTQQLKNQHLDTVRIFLSQDLNVTIDPNDVTFFISATEVLGPIGPGRQRQRRREYERFLGVFESKMDKNRCFDRCNQLLSRFDEIYLIDFNDDAEINDDNEIRCVINKAIESSFATVLKQIMNQIARDIVGFTNEVHENIFIQEKLKDTVDHMNVKVNDLFQEKLAVELARLSQSIKDILIRSCRIRDCRQYIIDYVYTPPMAVRDSACTERRTNIEKRFTHTFLWILEVFKSNMVRNSIDKELRGKLEDNIKSAIMQLKDLYKSNTNTKFNSFIKDNASLGSFIDIVNQQRGALARQEVDILRAIR